MKKLIALLLLSPLAFAEEIEMIDLQEYINTNSTEDPATMFYVATRCSALFSLAATLSKDSSENNQKFAGAGNDFLELALLVRMQIEPSIEPKVHAEITKNTMLAIFQRYFNTANKNYIDTGTYFTERMFRDTEICGTLNK